jgi:hypothetical protein
MQTKGRAMIGLVDWVGSKTCDAFSLFGAVSLVEASCSSTNDVFGLGLITIALMALFVFVAVVFGKA